MTEPTYQPTRYLTTSEVAERFRTNEDTVRTWRHQGTGPVGTRFGRRVLYSVQAVDDWERERIAADPASRRSA